MDTYKQKPDPKDLHDLVMHDLQQPTVFHHLIQDWPASAWTPEDLASVLGDKKVKIRIGLKEANLWESTQWEASCSYETTTLNHFCDWLRQEGHGNTSVDTPQDRQGDNPLMKYSQDKHWCYVDYKYMAELFEGHPDILQSIKWSDFGFRGRDGQQSTVWIGSQGATTPGHYDTYGCNLVAQIYGRKKWHLFPPSQSDALYQTRIPYEESSVFSPINIAKPDLNMYPQFSTATPYIVTLDPGDVLFVPPHWWHFVETIEASISVNTWIEMETDHKSRFGEAITRSLVSGMLPSSERHENSKWLNPTEQLCDTATNMEYLKMAATNLIQHQKQANKTDGQNQQTLSQHLSNPPFHNLQIPTNQVQKFRSCSNKHDITEDAASQNEPGVKRQKIVTEKQTSAQSTKLPDFVTLVPCLGQIYMKGVASCPDKTHKCDESGKDIDFADDNSGQTCSNGGSFHECLDKSLNKEVAKSLKSCDGVQQIHGEKAEIFELFLQSVTNPEVVKHISDIFLKKLQETGRL